MVHSIHSGPHRSRLTLALVVASLSAILLDNASAAPTPKVFRDQIEPHWFADNNRFWYRNNLPDDTREFVVVDALSGTRRPAFDHTAVAAALTELTGKTPSPDRLPIDTLEYTENGKILLLRGPTDAWRLNLDTDELKPAPEERREPDTAPATIDVRPSARTGPETEIRFVNQLDREVHLFWVNSDGDRLPYGTLQPGQEKAQHTFAGHIWIATANGSVMAVFEATENRAVGRITGQAGERPRRRQRTRAATDEPATSVSSPDGRWEAMVRDHNLWLRESGTDCEHQLSFDGSPGNSFHRDTSRARLIGMQYTRGEAPPTLPEVFWSPDSQHLVALQTTTVPERRVHLIESSPRDQLQPSQQSYPYLKAGDAIPLASPRLFDVATHAAIPIANTLFPNPWELSGFRWAEDSSRFTFVYNQRGHQVLRLLTVDPTTGEVRTIVNETSPTFIDYSSKFLCEWISDDEILWMSERDGWNHLYLYDVPAATLKRQVTHGDWVVRNLVHVDPDQREIWLRVAGIQPDQDPYHFHFVKVDLDRHNLRLLTEGDGTHSVQRSPDRRFFIDNWSRVDQPPVHELRRSTNGELLCRLETADAEEVLAERGRFPERFAAVGRDGVTPIYGLLHRPKDFDPNRRYPVVENIYAGPHDFHVPKAFRAVYRHQYQIADRGFIVVQIDGMGTSWRSKSFHDVAWRNLKDAGFPDRIAWMQAAAELHPELDLSRVGIYGGSAGGQNALAALLWHGDFYDVAVADCGCHDNRMDKIWWNEQWMGWPVGPWYAANSNTVNAHRLNGQLLLIVGELDKNVDPASTYQVARRLQEADKDFDLQIIMGAGHGAAETPYGSRRRAEFLVEHLRPSHR